VQQRWAVLTSGQVDLLSRNSTITFSRDASLGLNFVGINFYEGQTFIVRKKLAITSPSKMDGATVCVAAGSTEEKNAGDWFRERNMKVNIVTFAKNDDAIAAYDAERCDAYTAGIGAGGGRAVAAAVCRATRKGREDPCRKTDVGRRFSCALPVIFGVTEPV
jgi:general L-amino acid transport system substrate-binding protein